MNLLGFALLVLCERDGRRVSNKFFEKDSWLF